MCGAVGGQELSWKDGECEMGGLGRGMARLLVLMLLKEVSQWVRGDPESWYVAVKVGARGWSWRLGNKQGRSGRC